MSQRYTCLLGGRPWRRGGAERHLMCSTWGVISLGSLHVWEVTGRGLAASHIWPLPSSLCPSPSFVYSLDLSELAKAAKKKLQAVSLLRQGAPIPDPLFL